jgi:hypothetical protein
MKFVNLRSEEVRLKSAGNGLIEVLEKTSYMRFDLRIKRNFYHQHNTLEYKGPCVNASR